MLYSNTKSGTICSDGKNKCQLIYPNNISFGIGDEFTLNTGNVETNEGQYCKVYY